ncbi:MAG: hypothetical protein ABIK28_08090 [Planctomycetota bacterium]
MYACKPWAQWDGILVPERERIMVLRVLTLISILFLTASCGMNWQTLQVEKLSYGDLFRLTSHVIDTEGFVIDDANAHTGEIVTEWSYGKVVEVGRFPIRRRAIAHVDPAGDGYEIRLIIEQEALWKDYGVRDLKDQDGWEYHPNDKTKALQILRRIRVFVEEFKPSDEFYERYRRMDHLKKSTPELFDDPDFDEPDVDLKAP